MAVRAFSKKLSDRGFYRGGIMNLNLNSFFRIIGLILAVIGPSMLPSFVVSLIYGETFVAKTFIIIIIASLLAGVFLMKICKKNFTTLKVKDGFLLVSVCWFLSAAIGAIPFVATGSIPNPVDAFFESCSGFSTTGATILSEIEVLPKGILFWRSFTHWIGGMGILVFAIALMPSLGISGQNIAVSEAPGPTFDKTNAQMSSTAKSLYIIYIVFTVMETLLLLIGGMNLYDALLHTFGTVGTGGLSSYNDSIAHFDSTYIRIVISVFMVMCGVNFNLYYDSLKHGIKNLISDTEFKIYIFIVLGTSSFIAVSLMVSGCYDSLKDAVLDSTFQVSSIITTTGYITADYEQWPVVCQFILLILMIIGGCSASTSGGLKVIRAIVILKLIKRGISQRLHPNVVETIKLNGRTIPSDTITAIANHTFLYILAIFFGAILIAFENADLMTCFSSVITCLGNVGPGFGLVGPTENFGVLSDFSTFVLSVYMLAGRLELYTLFVLFTPRFWNQNY